jgi:hypothetical protein
MVKKSFFYDATKAEIKKGNQVDVIEIPEFLNLNPDQFTVVSPFVPKGFESARKFMKHGKEVLPQRYHSLDQSVSDGRTPVQLREEAFDKIKDSNFCGYSFMPIGRDRRKRKVSLVECMEGARIFAYANQVNGTGIDIRPYADAARVRREGAEIVFRVPSRTKGEKKTEFKMTSMPVRDSKEKYLIAQGVGSDHSCPSKRFNIRYRYTDDKESSGIVNVCAHEVAAYFKTVQHFVENEKNVIPLQMSPFAIPSQMAVDYYTKLGNNVLVEDKDLKGKDKLRKLNRAEKEIALWGLVKTFGHDDTFYSKNSRDGNVADYSWTGK